MVIEFAPSGIESFCEYEKIGKHHRSTKSRWILSFMVSQVKDFTYGRKPKGIIKNYEKWDMQMVRTS
jgi:hypothetical protein